MRTHVKLYSRLEALKELNRMLIDERLPADERPPVNLENYIEAQAEAIPIEEEE